MVDVGAAAASAGRAARIGTVFALSGAFAYGVNIIAARITTGQGISGPDIVVYRGLFFLPLAALMAQIAGLKLSLPAHERNGVFRFAVFAAGTALGYISSLAYLPVPMAVVIFYTYPLLVILISPYVDGIRLSGRRWVVALAAFVGILLAVGPQIDGLDPRGVALAFFGALCCAGMFIVGAGLRTHGIVTFFWSQVLVLPLALGLAVAGGGLVRPEQMAAVGLPFIITASGFFLGLLLQLLAAPRLSAASAGLLFLFEPIVAILGAHFWLGEPINPVQGFGMLLILAALVFDTLPMLRRVDMP